MFVCLRVCWHAPGCLKTSTKCDSEVSSSKDRWTCRLKGQIRTNKHAERVAQQGNIHTQVLMQTTNLDHRHYILVCGCHARFGACHLRNAAVSLPRSHCCAFLSNFFFFLHTYADTFLPPWNTRRIVVPVWGNLSRRWRWVTNTHWHLQADDNGDPWLAYERKCHCSLAVQDVDIKDFMPSVWWTT